MNKLCKTKVNAIWLVISLAALIGVIAGTYYNYKNPIIHTTVSYAEGVHTVAYSEAERNVLRWIFDVQDEFDELDDEIKEYFYLYARYEETSDGIYDVELNFMVKTDTYICHVIYDGYEDEEITEYGIMNDERIDFEDWVNIMTTKYPELDI